MSEKIRCQELRNAHGAIVFSQEATMEKTKQQDHSSVPGVIIDYSPAESGKYIGSPSIAVLPNGHYIASHDFFGPGTPFRTGARSSIFRSEDAGKTWEHVTDLKPQFWSTLFMYQGALYLMGAGSEPGPALIRRSTNGGETWTQPEDKKTGVLADDGQYHTAPVPVVVHEGRIWRAMEFADGQRPNWPAFVMSAPVDADLLRADSWTMTNFLYHNNPEQRWLEGNVVLTPDGHIVNILRLNGLGVGRAAMLPVADDGKTLSFDPEKDIIDFIGGGAKFTIRYDGVTKRYWSLVNKQKNPDTYRNILALTSSADLRNWELESIILRHEEKVHHAFQYVDWLFEGDDIIVASRTGWDGSNRAHDANYMTFHRVRNFRDSELDEEMAFAPLAEH